MLAHADEQARRLSPLVAEAVETIRNNYMALYGVDDLADALGVSKCHLVRTFSAEMGTSPGKYLTRTRLEAAKLLLLEREYNLEMIANLCGFSGANYLCRVFRREEGVSPRRVARHRRAARRAQAPCRRATTRRMCEAVQKQKRPDCRSLFSFIRSFG